MENKNEKTITYFLLVALNGVFEGVENTTSIVITPEEERKENTYDIFDKKQWLNSKTRFRAVSTNKAPVEKECVLDIVATEEGVHITLAIKGHYGTLTPKASVSRSIEWLLSAEKASTKLIDIITDCIAKANLTLETNKRGVDTLGIFDTFCTLTGFVLSGLTFVIFTTAEIGHTLKVGYENVEVGEIVRKNLIINVSNNTKDAHKVYTVQLIDERKDMASPQNDITTNSGQIKSVTVADDKFTTYSAYKVLRLSSDKGMFN